MTYRTTVAGSLPKPGWLAQEQTLWPTWRLDGDALAEAQADATRLAVLLQTRSGIECPSDGEQARVHFVHGFLAALDGIDNENKVRRGIRDNRYEADCPAIVAPIERKRAVHLTEARVARAATTGPLKFTLPGR